MAVGLPLKTTYANGDVYSASDVNDTNGTINANATPYAAGKNKIINGDFNINQRAFSSSVDGHNLYFYDRWIGGFVSPAGASVTFSAQTFTAGTAPVSGYESTNFFRMVTTGVVANGNTTTQIRVSQKIEDVRTFAGQTMTVSFWAKSASGTPKVAVRIDQNFGSGGSSTVTAIAGSVTQITTSWVRYSFTVAVPSISGKTIGTSSFTEVRLFVAAGSAIPNVSGVGLQDNTFDFWGVQAENGSVATAFQTATGTIQGELAACQRYYWRSSNNSAFATQGVGFAYSTTQMSIIITMPTQMRIAPTAIDYSNLIYSDGAGTIAVGTISLAQGSSRLVATDDNVTGATQFRTYLLRNNNNTAGYIGFSAEL